MEKDRHWRPYGCCRMLTESESGSQNLYLVREGELENTYV
jgi:hypothetical protein